MSTPAKYRKKPVVIEAMKLESNFSPAKEEVVKWASPNAFVEAVTGHLYISTLEGNMLVSVGDWVIKGIQGEFYPCKPDIFAKTYEVANDA